MQYVVNLTTNGDGGMGCFILHGSVCTDVLLIQSFSVVVQS